VRGLRRGGKECGMDGVMERMMGDSEEEREDRIRMTRKSQNSSEFNSGEGEGEIFGAFAVRRLTR
jgi:hypothetical protein